MNPLLAGYSGFKCKPTGQLLWEGGVPDNRLTHLANFAHWNLGKYPTNMEVHKGLLDGYFPRERIDFMM